MSGLGLVMTHDRFRAVDVSEYLYLDESSAAYLRPVVGSYVDGFLRPYDLWVSCFAFVCVCVGGLIGWVDEWMDGWVSGWMWVNVCVRGGDK